MLAYRVEHHRSDTGPYSDPNPVWELVHAHEDMEHPAPWEDTDEVYDFYKANTICCALTTKELVYAWFADFIELLAEYNYVLRTFEIPEGSYAAGAQIVFIRDDAECINSEELNPSLDPMYRLNKMKEEHEIS